MKTLCIIRDIYNALYRFETEFEQAYSLSINEAMLLCAIEETGKAITSTALSELTGMAPSHTSKVIRTVEDKGLIKRAFGETDKRQMYFTLTPKGEKDLKEINLGKIQIPDILQSIMK